MTAVTGMLIVFGVALGPLGALLWLLNRRDSRESLLEVEILKHLSSRGERGLVSASVRYALFSRRAVVTVDMSACSREQVWHTVQRLSTTLPPGVRLQVHAAVDPNVPGRLIVETSTRPFIPRPERASVAVS